MDTSSIPSIGGHPLCGIADNSTWVPTPEMYEGAHFYYVKQSQQMNKVKL